MDNLFRQDVASLPTLLREVVAFTQRFRADDRRPAGSLLRDVPSSPLPELGAGAQDAMRVFQEQWTPYLVASPSARYLGYVTGGTTPAALIGDWLTTAIDQNPQAVKGFGDVSAAIEVATIELLLELFSLPDTFQGGFVTGATMSSFTCLAVARQWAGHQKGTDIAKEGLQHELLILSATPHSSAVKCLAMLGLGSRNITPVATLPDREAMDVDNLETILRQHVGQPAIVIASGGTVNTVDFDDLQAITRLQEKYNFWLHVDAAFGGFAALSPDHRQLLAGWEHADSITIDNHKWLNVPYDSACWFIQRKHAPLQVATFQNSAAPYLGDPEADFNYLNLGPENSRRLRALPAWFNLRAYGKQGLSDIVNRCITTTRALAEAIKQSPDYELLSPVRLNVVAFTLKGATEAEIDRFVQRLNDQGRYFLTPTTLFGRRGLRAAFVNWQHAPEQVPDLMAALNAALAPSKIQSNQDQIFQ